MFVDFSKFRMTFGNLKYVKCMECAKKDTCNKIEKYNGTCQPINNNYYWNDYGCYQSK